MYTYIYVCIYIYIYMGDVLSPLLFDTLQYTQLYSAQAKLLHLYLQNTHDKTCLL